MNTDLISDRIRLVYEYNKESALFARVALIELERGKFLEALNILNDGIEKHHNYPSALLILALAKAYEGKEEEARETARIACNLINSPKTYDYYVNKIADIVLERKSISSSARTSFIQENVVEPQTELFEDKLDILAKELSKAKIIPKEDVVEITETKGQRVLSETLADIYLTQRNFEEAISMYEELINQKPEKAEFYLQKISEIRDGMSSGNSN